MKIGDYVRTKHYGIHKIDNFMIFIKDELEVIVDNLNQIEIDKKEIIKCEEKLIDLIEVGDYVNGKKVIKEHYTYMGETFIDLDTNDSWEWGIGKMPTKYIRSIVTHEQFKSMEYKVVEE